MTSLKLTLLGGFLLENDQGEIKVSAKKSKALLGYLAVNSGSFFSRDKLSTLLWENSNEAACHT